MKKILLLASALLVFSGCNKEDVKPNTPPQEGKMLTIGASSAPQTKVSLTDAEAGVIDVKWATSDMMRVFDLGEGSTNPSTSVTLKATDGGEGTPFGMFEGTDPRVATGTEENPLGALYPSTDVPVVTNINSWNDYELFYQDAAKSQKQIGNANLDHLPMYTYLAAKANMENTEVRLKHQSSFLRFEISDMQEGFVPVKLTIGLADGNNKMWSMRNLNGGDVMATPRGTATNLLTLDLENIVLGEDGKLTATMAVAPFVLAADELTVVLTGAEGYSYVFSKSVTMTYEAGMLHPAVLSVNDMTYDGPKALCADKVPSRGDQMYVAGLSVDGIRILSVTGAEMVAANGYVNRIANGSDPVIMAAGDLLTSLVSKPATSGGGNSLGTGMWIDWNYDGQLTVDEMVIKPLEAHKADSWGIEPGTVFADSYAKIDGSPVTFEVPAGKEEGVYSARMVSRINGTLKEADFEGCTFNPSTMVDFKVNYVAVRVAPENLEVLYMDAADGDGVVMLDTDITRTFSITLNKAVEVNTEITVGVTSSTAQNATLPESKLIVLAGEKTVSGKIVFSGSVFTEAATVELFIATVTGGTSDVESVMYNVTLADLSTPMSWLFTTYTGVADDPQPESIIVAGGRYFTFSMGDKAFPTGVTVEFIFEKTGGVASVVETGIKILSSSRSPRVHFYDGGVQGKLTIRSLHLDWADGTKGLSTENPRDVIIDVNIPAPVE